MLAVPADQAEAHELAERVRAILARWDEPSRKFMKRISDEVSVREIAEELGVSEWAAHRRWRKLRKRMAYELEMPLPEKRRRGRKKS